MKKLFAILFAVVMLLGTFGCGAKIPRTTAVFTGKIVSTVIGANNTVTIITLAGTGEYESAGGVYQITGVNNLKVFNADGEEVESGELVKGLIVEIGFDGSIAESYPAQLINAQYVQIKSNDGDLVGLYLSVLSSSCDNRPFMTDLPVGINLSQANNLSISEKSALVYVAMTAFGKNSHAADLAQLTAEGYVGEDGTLNAYLLTIVDAAITDNTLILNVEVQSPDETQSVEIPCVWDGESWSYTLPQVQG
ncbi:MAG TPA: hypothetical protein PK629_01230 [Oscillospiraceae bacterium]|nr:hypothetical protein [Oscillospiraceae bacterium]HPF55387.1 hypothetical protein [Clostridiales bacterium]HPK35599.1 hypothetical protein [Oscillospiraceae bacterium]HPR74663.1 hypothetical protein [Oscillospiraceae bacterium]